MPIYVACEYNDNLLGAVLAENEKLANAYFQGRDIYPHHYTIHLEENLKDHPTGVIPIFNTELVRKYDVGDSGVLKVIKP